jgi:hypothetical protein
MDNTVFNTIKPEASIIHKKVLSVLEKHCYKDGKGLIRFPEVNKVLSWLLHCNKSEREYLIFEMQQLGLIEVKPFHGIRIISQGKQND